MKKIIKYSQFINEMWDTIPEIQILKKDIREEDAIYEFNIDDIPYQVLITTRRYDDNKEDLQLEIHFSAKPQGGSKYTTELTGRNNMQKVMGSVWYCIIQWAKEVCKGGYLISLIISAKSEEKGDSRRAKIYSDFIARKASQVGIKISGEEDISKVYDEISIALGGSSDSVTTRYSIDKFPIDKLRSL